MCEFLSDANMQLRVPGGSFTIKDQHLPTLIMGNLSIEEAYKRDPPETIAALKERFFEVKLEKRENPFGVPINMNQESMNRLLQ